MLTGESDGVFIVSCEEHTGQTGTVIRLRTLRTGYNTTYSYQVVEYIHIHPVGYSRRQAYTSDQ